MRYVFSIVMCILLIHSTKITTAEHHQSELSRTLVRSTETPNTGYRSTETIPHDPKGSPTSSDHSSALQLLDSPQISPRTAERNNTEITDIAPDDQDEPRFQWPACCTFNCFENVIKGAVTLSLVTVAGAVVWFLITITHQHN